MILQVLDDCTINGPFGFRVCGKGELLTLPTHHAMIVLEREPHAFRILKPTPLLVGVAVRWLADDDSMRGPGIVQLIDGAEPTRRIAVLHEDQLRWINERDLVDVDPWPLLHGKLEEQYELFMREGEGSLKILQITEWILRHFGDAEDQGMR